jgi:hypothetical protein
LKGSLISYFFLISFFILINLVFTYKSQKWQCKFHVSFSLNLAIILN